MDSHENPKAETLRCVPWSRGKLIGQKPPLRPKHVWSVCTKLQMEGRMRDLAMFNLAIDSKLRGCDVIALKVEDVAPSGYAVDRATVRQRKTGQPVRFELTEQTRQAIDDFVRVAGKKPGEFLFTGRRGPARCLTTRQYARLVSSWIAGIGLDPHLFGTHSLRRTKASLIYRRTGNVELIGQHAERIQDCGRERLLHQGRSAVGHVFCANNSLPALFFTAHPLRQRINGREALNAGVVSEVYFKSRVELQSRHLILPSREPGANRWPKSCAVHVTRTSRYRMGQGQTTMPAAAAAPPK